MVLGSGFESVRDFVGSRLQLLYRKFLKKVSFYNCNPQVRSKEFIGRAKQHITIKLFEIYFKMWDGMYGIKHCESIYLFRPFNDLFNF